ncbi:MAG: hypothetical protein MSG64_15490 [Pyrinomonadaceae bacterium MAG19_C2-C3]|nr:hypothetical protein [Pyrinomonadaceae bacterium MAG19_C2-C3]
MPDSQTVLPASLSHSRVKCLWCGLVTFANGDVLVCPRCEAAFDAQPPDEHLPEDDFVFEQSAGEYADDAAPSRISFRQRALAVFAAVGFVLAVAYISLIVTSEPLTAAQKQQVTRAVEVLRTRGFTGEAFMLGNVTSFRGTDNWWNSYTGHADAYAATNFPFQIVTLYPEFFTLPVDDTERAAVLLHEARHLYGANEPRAFNETWRARTQLGWTKENYGETQTYRGVRELTHEYAPQIFRCGTGGDRDCTE